jgi:hypothetical protein
MNATRTASQLLRILRWLLWLAFLGYSASVWADRARHLDSFGQLVRTTEFLLFGLPMAAVAVGLLEMMMRDRAGLRRKDLSAER